MGLKIKDKLMVIISATAAFFSAVFYVLFRQAKEEKRVAKEKLEEQKKRLEEIQDTMSKEQTLKDIKKECDKIEKKTISNLDGDASRPLSDVLSDLAARSEKRDH